MNGQRLDPIQIQAVTTKERDQRSDREVTQVLMIHRIEFTLIDHIGDVVNFKYSHASFL